MRGRHMMRREVHIWRELRLRLIVRSIVRGTVDITKGDRGDVVCIWARLSVQLGRVDRCGETKKRVLRFRTLA
jgi:hypothetical protein